MARIIEHMMVRAEGGDISAAALVCMYERDRKWVALSESAKRITSAFAQVGVTAREAAEAMERLGRIMSQHEEGRNGSEDRQAGTGGLGTG